MKHHRTTLYAALATLAVALPGMAAANAPSANVPDEVQVAFDDLNIHSDAGARILYARLKKASREVCQLRPVRETGDLRYTSKARACYSETLTSAVSKIDSKALKTLHSS